MALIKCPECGKEVSDKAKSCPNCGFGVADYVNEKEEENKRENLILKWRDILRTMREDGSIGDVKYFVKSFYAMEVAFSGEDDFYSKEEKDKYYKLRDGAVGEEVNLSELRHIMGVFTRKEWRGPNTKFLFYRNEKGEYVPDLQYSDLVEKDIFLCEVVSCTCHGEKEKYVYCKELYEFSGIYKLQRSKYDTLHGEDKDIVNFCLWGPMGPNVAFLIIHDELDSERNQAVLIARRLADSYQMDTGALKGVKCPACGRETVVKISSARRIVSTGLLGLGSSDLGKTMECFRCHYKF